MFHLLSSLILILWYMNLMNNGQMDRGNENPTQNLPWGLRKITKKPQSGWSAPGFEPGTSRMRVSCVTTEPPRFWSNLVPSNRTVSLGKIASIYSLIDIILWLARLIVIQEDPDSVICYTQNFFRNYSDWRVQPASWGQLGSYLIQK